MSSIVRTYLDAHTNLNGMDFDDLEEIVAELGLREIRGDLLGLAHDATLYVADDGSAIVAQGSGWDEEGEDDGYWLEWCGEEASAETLARRAEER